MGDSAESIITVYNSLTASAYGTMWRPNGWQAADIGGQIAGTLGQGAIGVTDPEVMVAAINALKLAHGVLGTPDLLFGATIAAQFSELPAGQTVDLWREQVNGTTTPFTASSWAETFGTNDLKIVIICPYGAVTFGARRSDHDFSVTRYGVRHGTDPNGDGHFHRWGEGGDYTHMKTSVSPSVVSFGGVYHLFYQEQDGQRIFHSSSTDGHSWTPAAYINVNSSAAVCAVVYYVNQLHVFVRDPGGNRYFDYGSTDGGATFSFFNSTRLAATFTSSFAMARTTTTGSCMPIPWMGSIGLQRTPPASAPSTSVTTAPRVRGRSSTRTS